MTWSFCSNDRSQNFWIFQPLFRIFTMPAGLTDTIVECESEGLSIEKIKPPLTANISLSPKLK